MGGDEVGLHAQPQEAQAVGQVVLPDGRVPLGQQLGAPDVVDQDVDVAVVASDTVGQAPDLLALEVVDGDGDGFSARLVTSSAVSSMVSVRS